MRRWIQSWRRLNPDFEFSLSDHADVQAFFETEFPEHMQTFESLNDVERTDLWRLLIVSKNGGVYADVDTVCRKPASEWIGPEDEAVIGIDGDYLDRYPNWQAEAHVKSGGAYNLSLKWEDNVVAFANWTFAFTAGHPILDEVIRRIKINASDPFFAEVRPNWTIKKTGPGVFTDVIYDWLEERGHSAPELVRELRQTRSILIDGVRFVDRPAFHKREVLHFGMGSWKPMSIVVAWRKLSRHWH